jgi:hypothetical protein
VGRGSKPYPLKSLRRDLLDLRPLRNGAHGGSVGSAHPDESYSIIVVKIKVHGGIRAINDPGGLSLLVTHEISKNTNDTDRQVFESFRMRTLLKVIPQLSEKYPGVSS